MAFATFGPGILIVTRTDLTNQTPINIGYAQELSLDLKGTTKQLFGQNQYPLVAARGTIKASGKFVAAEISGIAWNAFFYGQSAFTAGGYAWQVGEAHVVPAGGTFTVTAGGSFDTDLGVVYGATNLPVLKGTVAPGVGSYNLTAGGVYVLNTADVGKTVNVTYSASTAVGQNLVVTNQPIGTTPTFQLDYYTNLNQPSSTPFAVRVYSCIAGGHGMAFKLEDFMMPNFEFDFFANSAGNILEYVFPQIG